MRIPLGDPGLRTALRRTRVVRLVLAAALAAAGTAALVLAVRLDEGPRPLLPPGRSGVIVLDVSSSVTSDTYRQIDRALAEAIATQERYGLVVFSDSAYEALPPGTRARELRAFRRFFTPLKVEPPPGYPPISVGNLPFPSNPWQAAFSGGTRISSGLRLALEVLRRDRIDNGAILLVSDLGDDPVDIPALTSTLIALREARVPLRVVALSPSPEDKALFEDLVREHGAVTEAPRPPRTLDPPPVSASSAEIPRALVATIAVLLALLAVNELLLGRLAWREAPR